MARTKSGRSITSRVCDVEGCGNPHNSKGKCSKHTVSSKVCGVEDCSTPLLAKGYCPLHYQRFHRLGDPLAILPRAGNSKPRPVLIERTCKDCGLVGSLDLFVKHKNQCKTCANQYKMRWAKVINPQAAAASRERANNHPNKLIRDLRTRARKLGLDADLVEDAWVAHPGVCEICGGIDATGKSLAIDHDHETNQFRGFLCGNCNNGLGRFKDDVVLLQSAALYLQKNS